MARAAKTTVKWASMDSRRWWNTGWARRSALVIAEGCLDSPEVVVGRDHAVAAHHLDRQIGRISFKASELAGAVDGGLVQLFCGAGDLQKPCLLQRCLAGGHLLGFGDLGVDRLVITLLAFERPLVDYPPLARLCPAAHHAGRFQDLLVDEVVAVALEVVCQVIGRLG